MNSFSSFSIFVHKHCVVIPITDKGWGDKESTSRYWIHALLSRVSTPSSRVPNQMVSCPSCNHEPYTFGKFCNNCGKKTLPLAPEAPTAKAPGTFVFSVWDFALLAFTYRFGLPPQHWAIRLHALTVAKIVFLESSVIIVEKKLCPRVLRPKELHHLHL